MAQVLYLTHPEVVIDPAVAVPDWGLSAHGAARVADLAKRGAWSGWHVVTSAERKALETAWPLAAAAGAAVEVRPDMHENDRSATGYLPGAGMGAGGGCACADHARGAGCFSGATRAGCDLLRSWRCGHAFVLCAGRSSDLTPLGSDRGWALFFIRSRAYDT